MKYSSKQIEKAIQCICGRGIKRKEAKVILQSIMYTMNGDKLFEYSVIPKYGLPWEKESVQ
jgi:hypothetical protein